MTQVLDPVGGDTGFARLAPISLADLDVAAALQERVDRKYVLTRGLLDHLIGGLGARVAVLEIDGRRTFGYRSVYFDTEAFDAYRGAAHQRRRRFKVRTRSYVDTGTAMLEVKTKGARNKTVKRRQPREIDRGDVLGPDGEAFVDRLVGRPGLGALLRPTLMSTYRRTTLVDLDDVARLTIDSNLRCVDWTGRDIRLDDRVVVETKSSAGSSAADRWLWANGARPEKISKYGTGLAALHPELPSNKWHRTLKRHFAR